MLYAIVWTLVRVLAKVFCACRVYGTENLPPSGGVILAGNHVSYLDPPIAATSIWRRVRFVAKRELFSIPVFGALIAALGAFPIARGRVDREGLRTAERLLREGKVVLVFPEGTRSPNGRLQPPEPGLGLLALRTEAPVVPMALVGTEKALPFNSPILRPAKITVRIGAPLRFPEYYGKPITRAAVNEVAALTMQAIAAMLPPDRHPVCRS